MKSNGSLAVCRARAIFTGWNSPCHLPNNAPICSPIFWKTETAVPDLDLDLLAGQFKLSTEQLQDFVSTARDLAAQNGRSLENQDLFAAARAHSNPKLASLAKKITPRYSWEDLVLPADQVEMLREMVQTVRSRPLVLEEWGHRQKADRQRRCHCPLLRRTRHRQNDGRRSHGR